MIITIISMKGGVGKSTIAQNLAVSLIKKKIDACILDADSNESTSTWSTYRDDELDNVPVFHLAENGSITQMINNLKEKYDTVIVDCPPAIESTTSKAVAKSDFSLIPIATTGGSDIWATEKFLQHIELLRDRLDADLPTFIIANRFERNVNLHKAYVEALKKYEEPYNVTLLKTVIAKRNAYGEANMGGASVLEWDNDKAKKEIKNLTQEILAIKKSMGL